MDTGKPDGFKWIYYWRVWKENGRVTNSNVSWKPVRFCVEWVGAAGKKVESRSGAALVVLGLIIDLWSGSSSRSNMQHTHHLVVLVGEDVTVPDVSS